MNWYDAIVSLIFAAGLALCLATACSSCRTGQAINLTNCREVNIRLESGAVVNSKEFPFDIARNAKVSTIP